ncbi:MAG: hypothetical protein R6U44_04625 [Archaeoglobaceae archaeon]
MDSSQILEIVKWIVIVFIAGFIGYFGKHLSKIIIAFFHQEKEKGKGKEEKEKEEEPRSKETPKDSYAFKNSYENKYERKLAKERYKLEKERLERERKRQDD